MVLPALHRTMLAPIPEEDPHAQWQSLITRADLIILRSSSSFPIEEIPQLLNDLRSVQEDLLEYRTEESPQPNADAYLNTITCLIDALVIKQSSVDLYNRSSPTCLPEDMIRISNRLLKGATYESSESRTLGEGCFGVVRAVKLDTTPLAEKTVLPGKTTSFHDPEKLRREAALLMALSHKNIVSIAGFKEQPRPALLLGRANHGSLCDNLSRKALYRHRHILEVLTGIATGLSYLHEQKVTHCDLHWGNIGLHIEGDVFVPKIWDFELASLKTPIEASEGNLLIQSPEALRMNDALHYRACRQLRFQKKHGTNQQQKYPPFSHTEGKDCYFKNTITTATDVWSFAMIAFSLLSGGQDLYSTCRIRRRNFLLRSVRFGDISYLRNALAHPELPYRPSRGLGLHSKDPLCKRLLEQVIAPSFQRDYRARPSAEALVKVLTMPDTTSLAHSGFMPI